MPSDGTDGSAPHDRPVAPWPGADEFEVALVRAARNRSGISFFEGDELAFDQDQLGGLAMLQGAFGYVYRARQGRKTWALKVFSSDVPERQRRYAEVSAHLRTATSPVFVDFEYADDAITVRTASGASDLFPALRMAWCDGNALDVHLERTLSDGYDADRHVKAWLRVLDVLRSCGVAHGDLQHENVMVTKSGRMRLIDYDGMFVPSLSGLEPSEDGQPAYQHPGRRNSGAVPFDANLDGVAGLVILATLAGVTAEIWASRNPEGLVLGSDDLANPLGSPKLDQLASTSSRSAAVVDLLRVALGNEPGPCPQLDAAAQVWGVKLRAVHVPAAPGPRVRSRPRQHAQTVVSTAALPRPVWIDQLGAPLPDTTPVAEDRAPTSSPAPPRTAKKHAPKEPTAVKRTAPPALRAKDLLTLLSMNAGLAVARLAELRNVSEHSVRRGTARLRGPDGTPHLDTRVALTRRQAEVVELRLAGASEAEAADRLSVQPATVRKHVADAAAAIERSKSVTARALAKEIRALERGPGPSRPTATPPVAPARPARTPIVTAPPPAPAGSPPAPPSDEEILAAVSRTLATQGTTPPPPPPVVPRHSVATPSETSSTEWWWGMLALLAAAIVIYLFLQR